MGELIIEDFDLIGKLIGHLDQNLKQVEEAFGVKCRIANNLVQVSGEDSTSAVRALETLYALLRDGKRDHLEYNEVSYVIELVQNHRESEALDLRAKPIAHTAQGKPLYPKTLGQKRYIECIQNKDIVFGVGPAGTGKTYLAVALAADSLRNKEYERIVLTRPAVEAGESLGFLPGDLKEKVDPYLRPIYDALFEILGGDRYLRYMERGIIEIAPLAYMRGRTLDNSFIVLDEAQNTTPEQMKMFLTRLGYSSKMVITGDITQTDLQKRQISGLVHARKILRHTRGISFVDLQKVDIVRHPLVRRVIEAYENEQNENHSQAAF